MFFNTNLKIISSDPKKREILEVSATADYIAGLIQNIQFLFERQQLCDVTLIAENDEFKVEAHRVILSAASPYFLGMFGGCLREADAKHVKLNQVDAYSLKMIVNFIYTASIELTPETVEDILKTAQLLQLDSLEVLCCDFIAKQLDTSNCLGIALFAEQYNFQALYKTAGAFVCRNFMQLRDSKEFFLLSFDQLSKFISSDEVCVSSEEEVFHSVMSWVEHDKPKREEFIGKLLNHVRFPLLLPKFIASTVQLVSNSFESERLICKALKWHFLPEFRPSLFSEEQIRLRNLEDVIIAISGWNYSDNALSVGLFYSVLNEWIYRECPGPSERRVDFGSTSLNGKLFIAGGKLSSGEATNRVDCLDLKTLKWTELQPMATKRYALALGVLNGQVYALGGNDGKNALRSVEKWDPLTGKWRFVRGMHKPNMYPRVAFRLNSLCVTRQTQNSNTFAHDTYDSATNIWTDNWLTTNGDLLGMGKVNVLLIDYYIAVSRTSITRYNLGTKTSVNIPTTFIKSECTDCSPFGDRIIVYGENEFQVYNVLKDEWKTLPRLKNDQGKVVVISS